MGPRPCFARLFRATSKERPQEEEKEEKIFFYCLQPTLDGEQEKKFRERERQRK